VPDQTLVVIALQDPLFLGYLSSCAHLTWSSASGGTLEDRPRYSTSRCFDTFPFPDPVSEELKDKIRNAAEELDATRKRVLAENPDLTLTKLYNVLERIREIEAAERVPTFPPGGGRWPSASAEGRMRGPPQANPPLRQGEGAPSPARGEGEPRSADVPPLTDAEEDIRDRGLVLIIRELHDTIDRLVAEAYSWSADLSDQEILARLVALNRERAEEERSGIVRWLRPDYQIPKFGTPKEKAEQIEAELPQALVAAKKPTLPRREVERTAAIFAMLAGSADSIDASGLAARFRQGKRVESQVHATLLALARMGHIASGDGGRTFGLQRVG
jgi:hypothetical protein